MSNWIKKMKNTTYMDNNIRSIVNINTLNSKQRLAYHVVRDHIIQDSSKNDNKLLLRLEGTAGTGKSCVINSWCKYKGCSQCIWCYSSYYTLIGCENLRLKWCISEAFTRTTKA